jgi:hypothetical protein
MYFPPFWYIVSRKIWQPCDSDFKSSLGKKQLLSQVIGPGPLTEMHVVKLSNIPRYSRNRKKKKKDRLFFLFPRKCFCRYCTVSFPIPWNLTFTRFVPRNSVCGSPFKQNIFYLIKHCRLLPTDNAHSVPKPIRSQARVKSHNAT